MPVMHACLQIPEILRMIFEEVTQVTNSVVRPSYTTLYHLAMTCRAFRGPALDVLWAHIPTSDVLVLCLPQDARSQPIRELTLESFDQFECTPSGITAASRVRLLRPLTDDDWATFRMYARRVRSLTFEEYDVEYYSMMRDHGMHDSAALALLGPSASSPPPFPLLRELCWYDKRDVLLPCLQRCISATLTQLVIHSELWPSEMVNLVAGLGKACPKIKEFRCSMPTASVCAMLSDLVTYWDDLEILETGAVNAQALQHLASLEKLRELKMLVPEGYSLNLEPTSTVQRHVFDGQVQYNCCKYGAASRFFGALANFREECAFEHRHSFRRVLSRPATFLPHRALQSQRFRIVGC
ncbi:hypothetical protein F4604DRAFT_561298 [Suillus subluteus]|nr:hypothetical protein F4604DRAFT_561298 [Suillus subluteus]